jgi:hypothetical protein
MLMTKHVVLLSAQNDFNDALLSTRENQTSNINHQCSVDILYTQYVHLI